jgi:hypothetical protein
MSSTSSFEPKTIDPDKLEALTRVWNSVKKCSCEKEGKGIRTLDERDAHAEIRDCILKGKKYKKCRTMKNHGDISLPSIPVPCPSGPRAGVRLHFTTNTTAVCFSSRSISTAFAQSRKTGKTRSQSTGSSIPNTKSLVVSGCGLVLGQHLSAPSSYSDERHFFGHTSAGSMHLFSASDTSFSISLG